MIETITNDPIPPKDLLDINCELGPLEARKGEYGLLVSATSPKWEELFKKISMGKTSFVKKNGFELELYDFPAADSQGFYSFTPSRELFENAIWGTQKPTLFFLRMKGLSDGVSVFFHGMHEFDIVRKYANQAADESLSLYKKLLGGSVRARVILEDWKKSERVVR